MDIADIIILVTNGLILIGGLYLAFFKSYFTEKGKNLATREDIEEITKKVEAIKVEFIKETERLKFELQFETQVNLGYHNDMKAAVIQLYEVYSLWLTTVSEAQDNSIEHSSKQLNEGINELSAVYTKFLLAEAKAELYISEDSFFDKLRELKKSTSNFHNSVESFLLKLFFIEEDIEEMELEEENDVNVSYQKEINEKNAEKISEYNSFQDKVRDEYKNIVVQNYDFADMCRAILKNTKLK